MSILRNRALTTEHREWLLFVLLVGPNLFLFGVFTYWPLVYNGYLSFVRWDMLAPVKVWVGVANYTHLFSSPGFGKILLNTTIFTFGSVAAICAIGLLIALLLNQHLMGRDAVRGVVFSPVMLSGAAIGIVLAILAGTPDNKRSAGVDYLTYATSPDLQVFWAQNTGYMPVRKSALESEAMQTYFEEFPQFKTATEQLALTRAQDSARVFVPNGDQIIGKGLERITVQADDVATAFADVQAILEQEAVPVVEALRAIEG
jgi:ABC-type sulfate transport system permease component